MTAHSGRLSYLAGKLLRYSITLLIILTLVFFIPRAMPGDPIVNLMGEDALHLDQSTLDALRAEYGLDRPLHEQYITYLSGILTLDFGYSIHKNLKVRDLIADRFFWTFVLIFPSLVIGGGLALILGSAAGFRRGDLPDRLLTALITFLYTVPSFLLAMVIVSIFSFHLGWFPLGNLSSGGMHGVSCLLDILWHLLLPMAVLSIMEAASMFLVVRNSVTQVMGEYFIFVAKAKGLPERTIKLKHVIRTILPQFISIMALNFGFIVSGALIIEIIFSLNGMGTLIYDAVMARDYPVIQGCFVVLAMCVLAANFMADLLYGIADPRIGDSKSVDSTI
jgi:peptide/nickel transport system permease protein